MTHRSRTILFCLLLVSLTVLVFQEVGTHQFVFDDLGFISINSMVKPGLTWNGFTWAFTTRYMGIWHPVTWLSHMLDCQLFGQSPVGPHLTNLSLHILNTLLLFLLLQFCTGVGLPSFLVAALFAVHPLHVESVAWVAERKDVLSTSFWLLTMWAYMWYVQAPGWKPYVLTLLGFCLGLMAKPMLVTLPIVLLLWDYWPLQRWSPATKKMVEGTGSLLEGRFPRQKVPWGRLVGEKVPLQVLAAVSSIVTVYSQVSESAVASLEQFSLATRVSNALVAYASYLGKTIWPRHLAVYYPHPGNSIPLWEVLVAAFIMAAVSIFVLRRARSYPYLTVGWLWFIGTLAPVIGLLQVGSQAMADRYTYIPLIGLFIMVAWGLADLQARWRCPRFLMPLLSIMMIMAYAACAWFQVRHWRNAVALFEHTLSVTQKNAMAQGNLGQALYFRGEVIRASGHFQEAIRLDPPNGLNGLAWVMATTSNAKYLDGYTAVQLAKQANQLTQYSQPDYLDTLAAAYAAAGDFPRAVDTARQALEQASQVGRTELARNIDKRISLYQQGQAYRDETYDTFQK